MHYTRWYLHGDPLKVIPKGPPGHGAGLAFLRGLPKEDVGCITWPFGRGANGYGVVNFLGRQTTASRASCGIHHGPPPCADMEAAHSCGNGAQGCVAPAHLRWATVEENAADKNAHGTVLRGERHNMAKLSEDDVRQIRAEWGTVQPAALADRYNITRGHAWAIAKKRTWRHVQ